VLGTVLVLKDFVVIAFRSVLGELLLIKIIGIYMDEMYSLVLDWDAIAWVKR